MCDEMLITTSLGAIVFASIVSISPAGTPSPLINSVAPMVINVIVDPDVPRGVVNRLLEEADAIWRAGGFTFVWQRAPRESATSTRLDEAGPYQPSRLRVVIGD